MIAKSCMFLMSAPSKGCKIYTSYASNAFDGTVTLSYTWPFSLIVCLGGGQRLRGNKLLIRLPNLALYFGKYRLPNAYGCYDSVQALTIVFD